MYFNPRSPHGERPKRVLRHFEPGFISIHAPRTGSDHLACALLHERRNISIHAPRTGSDRAAKRHDEHRNNFNPRSPHGERRGSRGNPRFKESISIHAPRTGSDVGLQSVRSWAGNFNPRSPHGERQRLRSTSADIGIFQSTLPARGATGYVRRDTRRALAFQSTLPARGATRGK